MEHPVKYSNVLIFSSIVSFYGPLTVMCVTYFRIYKAAVAHTKSLRLGAKQLTNCLEGHGGQEVVLRMHRGGAASSTASTSNGGINRSDFRFY